MKSNCSATLKEKALRRWLANKLASWARRIYPQSEEAMAFTMDRMVDFVLTGKSEIKVTIVPDEQTAAISNTGNL